MEISGGRVKEVGIQWAMAKFEEKRGFPRIFS